MNTFIGIKQHMTQIWDSKGNRLPVTVVETNPMQVTQVKSNEKDGYTAVQVGVGKAKKLNKPLSSHVKKSGVQPRFLQEILVSDEFEVGATITIGDVLQVGDVVTVRGTSKGKGFAGGMKRWGFKGGPKTHGQSDRARAPGSIGQGTDPGRVHKGKKMAGRMGNQQHAIRSLQVVKIDDSNGVLWLSGPVPGTVGAVLTITKTSEGTFDAMGQQQEQDIDTSEEDNVQPEQKESIVKKDSVNSEKEADAGAAEAAKNAKKGKPTKSADKGEQKDA